MVYRIGDAAAKGFGVFATQLIRPGTRLIIERPLLMITDQQPDVVAAAKKLTAIGKETLHALALNDLKLLSIASLWNAAWRSFPRISSFRETRATLNIFNNNNFNLFDAKGTRALFPTVARLNHSCIPNAQGNFNAAHGSFTVHALREIAVDEEVTICYLQSVMASADARQAKLEQGYGFTCACEICTATSSKMAQSVARRSALRASSKAFSALENPILDAQLVFTRQAIETYELEGLAGRELASLYSVAAGLASKIGNNAQALTLAAKSVALEKDAVGEDSPLYIARCAELNLLGSSDRTVKKQKPGEAPENMPELSYAPWM